MKNKFNQDILKGVFLALVSIMILSNVYYLNIEPHNDQNSLKHDYFKSDICYFALNGIKSDYHYHFQLNITINGERIVIPENIGFETNEQDQLIFLHPIHTYDNSGRIHVETTKNTTAKLDFFFQIWDKEFNNNEIFDYEIDEEHELIIKKNDVEVYTFEETILEPYIFIEINYKTIN